MSKKTTRLTKWMMTTVIALLLVSTNSFVQAQSMNCGFNEVFEENMNNGSHFYGDFYENEDLIIETMNDPQMLQLLGSNSSYTIPVVVHVMHLGEPENIGSNIPDTQIIQAIQDLNNMFANANGMGVDIGIQFCLAERTPEGVATDGIVRVNAANICAGLCYGTSGITVGGSLGQAVKAESIWPNDEYINIWVVHNIVGALGYATFPSTSPTIDGIVIDKDYFGIDGSKVMAHEAGHFFNLFHTFQGDCTSGTNCLGSNCNQTNCPTNNPCDNDPTNDMDEVCCRVQGDRVCDTPPHKRSCFDCNPTGTNDCDGGSSNALFVYNYMDYSDLATCIDRFTDGQRMRMRCALMELRAPLMISSGCVPACTTAVAQFHGPSTSEAGNMVTFTNASSGGTNEIWEINGTEINTGSGPSNLVHTFDGPGLYEVCLTVSNPNCTNKFCLDILIIGVDPCTDFDLDECEALLNGDISQIKYPDSSYHFDTVYEFDKICNWFNRKSSPDFCFDEVNGNSFNLYINTVNNESVGTQRELDLIPGKEYYIRFDYGIVANLNGITQMESFSVGLSKTFYEGTDNKVIAFFENPPNDQPKASRCDVIRPSYYEGCFTYEEGDGKFLYVEGESSGYNILSIANMSVDPCKEDICEAEPVITYTQDSCAFTFTAINTGDPGDCHWDFGYGPTAEGCEVSHEYLFGGTFTVCLTIACSEYTQVTVCDTITVSEDCEDCTFLETPVIATQCEEDSTGSYLAKVEFDIPVGYTPCNDSDLLVWSNDVFISVTSFLIENVDSTTDHVIGCFNLTPYQGYDFETNGATVYITLCDPNGEMVCYSFDASGLTCEECLDDEVVSVAVCEDPDLSDDIYLYGGSAEIVFPNIPGVTYEECGYTSTEAGYTQTVSGSNPFTIDYAITTTSAGVFEASTLLCFTSTEVDEVSQEKIVKDICLTLTINVLPCPPIMEECVQRWATKDMSCDSTSNGNAYFNFSMDLDDSGYEICEGGLFGIVEGGGTVAVNSGTIIGNTFSYDVDILMPCGFDQSLVYELRLFLCNDRGEFVCFLFPFKFSCEKECEIRDDDERGDGEGGGNGSLGGGRSETGMPSDGIAIFPNPTSDRITIQLSKATAEQHTIYILDHLGRVLLSKGMANSLENIDLRQMAPGLHFVRILDQENNTVKIQKIVVLE